MLKVEDVLFGSDSPISLREDKIGDVILRLLSNGFW